MACSLSTMVTWSCERCHHKYDDQKQFRACKSCPHLLCNKCYERVKVREQNKCPGCRTKYENTTKARRAHKVSKTPMVFKRRFNVNFLCTSMLRKQLAIMFTRRRILAMKAPTKVWWDIENHRIPAELNRKNIKWIGTHVIEAIKNLGYTGEVKVIAIASETKKIPPHVVTGLRDDESKVDLQIVGKSGLEVADDEIKNQMYEWHRKTLRSGRPGNAMLLGGDSGYLRIVESIVRSGFTFFLGFDINVTTRQLVAMAKHSWPFRGLINAPEKSKNLTLRQRNRRGRR